METAHLSGYNDQDRMYDPGFESDYVQAGFLYSKTPSLPLNRYRGSFDLSTLLTSDSRYRSRTPFTPCRHFPTNHYQGAMQSLPQFGEKERYALWAETTRIKLFS